MITNPYPVVERFPEETTYNDAKSKSKAKFPNIAEPQSVHLSVVVPAYNEEERCEYTIFLLRRRLLSYLSEISL